jgi:hypothetical protein
MPTTLTLTYTAYAQVTVPNAIAKKIQDGTYKSWNKWGDLYYEDEKGEEHKIAGHCGECDYKRAESEVWEDEEDEEAEHKMKVDLVMAALFGQSNETTEALNDYGKAKALAKIKAEDDNTSVTEDDIFECYDCHDFFDCMQRDGKDGICGDCRRCCDCGCECECD